ncbi:MAG TPA: HD domain-containing phosphohydrolase, partial [Labilithrix sp.]|nr:HD domain-containing phosphohydrolase [Labilithrix sp.]
RRRTSCWASLVAAMMDLPTEEVEQSRLGAILHDVGQITIPPHAFARPGSLTTAERALLDEHPSAGTRIVDAMPALRCALPVVGSHHERQDGSGYPQGLAGDAIPGPARAFQVVDAYDALRRGRPHSPARSHGAAIAELTRHAGRQHDSRAVLALATLGEEALDAALRDAAM